MTKTNRATTFKRLILKIERDLVAQARLRERLTVADATVANNRKTLRAIKARIKRARQH
jgi:hypothetical protein